jgi:hypothetical protein
MRTQEHDDPVRAMLPSENRFVETLRDIEIQTPTALVNNTIP